MAKTSKGCRGAGPHVAADGRTLACKCGRILFVVRMFNDGLHVECDGCGEQYPITHALSALQGG